MKENNTCTRQIYIANTLPGWRYVFYCKSKFGLGHLPGMFAWFVHMMLRSFRSCRRFCNTSKLGLACKSTNATTAKNVAHGDTVSTSEGREIGNAAKGIDLVTEENLKYTTIEHGAQAFEGDLRSTSALGIGDGLYTHTAKWNEARL